MTTLITGGTGTLGRLLLSRLPGARTLSRSTGADLSTGHGVDEALAGVTTVVHCAGSAKGDDEKARVLCRAARRAGVRHLVFISVVGADRVPVRSAMDRVSFGYYAAKRGAEQVIEGSGIGWTTLRATQFHTLALLMAEQLARMPVALVPAGLHMQPVDPSDVADRMAELAVGEPAGLVDEMGGPEVYSMADLVRGYLTATGRRRPVVGVRFAGAAYRAMRAGANLTPAYATGTRTWEEFLATRVRTRVTRGSS